MSDDRVEPRRFLPLARPAPSHSGGDGTARPVAEDRAGIASVRLPQNYGGTATARLRGQPQARTADDAGRQPIVRATACLRNHDRLTAQPGGIPELGPRDNAYGG